MAFSREMVYGTIAKIDQIQQRIINESEQASRLLSRRDELAQSLYTNPNQKAIEELIDIYTQLALLAKTCILGIAACNLYRKELKELLEDSNVLWSFGNAVGHMIIRHKNRKAVSQQFQYNYILRTAWKQSTKYTKKAIELTRATIHHHRKQMSSLQKALALQGRGNYSSHLLDFLQEYESEKKLKLKNQKFWLDQQTLKIAQSLTPAQVVGLFGVSQFPANPIGGIVGVATLNPWLGGGLAIGLNIIKGTIIVGFLAYTSKYGAQV